MTAQQTTLSGIKVLDMSRVLAGPWCGQMLADLGADVIKIEREDKGDDTRQWGPPYFKDGQSAYFASTNRGKRSFTVDISDPKGAELVRNLATKADIVIENFKVGGLKKYALDYESLKKLNPRLIYCSITGFGQNGPYANKPGYDFMIQAMGGLMHITGNPDTQPVKVGVAVADIMTGMYACVAILAALNYRHISGIGQYIDLALLDSQVAMLANQAGNYLASGESPVRLGNAHPNIVPYQVFKTNDDFIIVAVGNDSQFSRLCKLLDLEEIINNKDYASNKARVENRQQLVDILAEKFLIHPSKHWLASLEQHNIPCGPINDLKQVFNHPQIKHRNMQQSIEVDHEREFEFVANPIKFSQTPITYSKASPELGEHNQEILDDWLDKN